MPYNPVASVRSACRAAFDRLALISDQSWLSVVFMLAFLCAWLLLAFATQAGSVRPLLASLLWVGKRCRTRCATQELCTRRRSQRSTGATAMAQALSRIRQTPPWETPRRQTPFRIRRDGLRAALRRRPAKEDLAPQTQLQGYMRPLPANAVLELHEKLPPPARVVLAFSTAPVGMTPSTPTTACLPRMKQEPAKPVAGSEITANGRSRVLMRVEEAPVPRTSERWPSRL